MKSQLVIIEYNNCGPQLERFTSKRKIAIERVAKFLEKRDGADWERDSITFTDEPTTTPLEKHRKRRIDKDGAGSKLLVLTSRA